MNPLLKSCLLTLPFVALYFGMRALPVEPCEFLHEETYNEDGALDYCGPGDAGFIDLSIRKWPLKLDFRSLDEPTVGEPCRFEMNLRQFDGSPLTADDVALSHTKKIHLLAVDESLTDYQHLHPTADSLYDGVWKFELTPRNPGKYVVFLDFIPVRSPRRVLLKSSFEVVGQAQPAEQPSRDTLPLAIQMGGNHYELMIPKVEGSAQVQSINLRLRVTDDSGKLSTLSPVMGAFAHMVAFDPELNGFAHLHPLENALPAKKDDLHPGELTFNFLPPKQGRYRLWAQLKLDGSAKETFVPFDLEVGI